MSFDLDLFRQDVLTDPLVYATWHDKYRWKEADGSPREQSVAETRERVVRAVYAKDPSQQAFSEALGLVQGGYLVPAGRVNAGAGLDRAVTLTNCFVNETIQDSMVGIQRGITNAALTMQQGGGIGTDFSSIRPNGALVKRTGSISSGVIPFMDQMSAMSDTVISAGTRRGAMMATLRCDHPDLWNPEQFETVTRFDGSVTMKNPSFISAKRQRGRLTQFNVSILATEAFMEAVRRDTDWDLGFHVPRADGQHVDVYDKPFAYDVIERDNQGNKIEGDWLKKGALAPWYVYRRVKARELWNDIMRSTYVYAEPGIIFIDRVNERNNLFYCEAINCTNPCFTGDTLVITSAGPKRFSDLARTGNTIKVLSVSEDGKVFFTDMTKPRLTRRKAPVVNLDVRATRIQLAVDDPMQEEGTIRCTPNHEFYLSSDVKVRADELTTSDDLHWFAEDDHIKRVYTERAYLPSGQQDIEDVYCGTVRSTGRFFIQATPNSYVLVSNCGEQPLPEHGTCCLSSVNLAFMVKDPFSDDARFDFDLYRKTIRQGVRFLDNVLTTTKFPLQAQQDESDSKRRIGLGVTGLADALVQLRIVYGSDRSVELSRELSAILQEESYSASADLAAERGAFPLFNPRDFANSYNFKKLPIYVQEKILWSGLRNGVLNTVAPNGTISLYTGNVPSGIEPIFSTHVAFRKMRQPDGSFKEFEIIDYAQRMFRAMFPGQTMPDYFVGAHDVHPRDHVRVLAAWQEHIDAAISKTVNCPEELPFEEFAALYQQAYELGCKGCTTYRPDPISGRGSVLSEVKERTVVDAIVTPAATALHHDFVHPRPDVVPGRTYKVKWPQSGENVYITVNNDEGRPLEVFIKHADSLLTEWTDALSRMITGVLRRGGDIKFIIEQLQQVGSAKGGVFMHGRFHASQVAAIATAIETEFRELGVYAKHAGDNGLLEASVATMNEVNQVVAALIEDPQRADVGTECPICHEFTVVRETGCRHCVSCGHEECG